MEKRIESVTMWHLMEKESFKKTKQFLNFYIIEKDGNVNIKIVDNDYIEKLGEKKWKKMLDEWNYDPKRFPLTCLNLGDYLEVK